MKTTKTRPLPVRFDGDDDAFLQSASKATGMNVSELVRRSVRLMKRQQALMNSYSFLLELRQA